VRDFLHLGRQLCVQVCQFGAQGLYILLRLTNIAALFISASCRTRGRSSARNIRRRNLLSPQQRAKQRRAEGDRRRDRVLAGLRLFFFDPLLRLA
jgi:hypothetical protein